MNIVERQALDLPLPITPILDAERRQLTAGLNSLEDLVLTGSWDDAAKDRLGTPGFLPAAFRSRVERALQFTTALNQRYTTGALMEYPELVASLSAEFGPGSALRPIGLVSLGAGETGLLVLTDPPGQGISINGTDYGASPVFIRPPQTMTSAVVVATGPAQANRAQTTQAIAAGRMNVCFVPVADWAFGTARIVTSGWTGPTASATANPNAYLIDDFERNSEIGFAPARPETGMGYSSNGNVNVNGTINFSLRFVLGGNGARFGTRYLACTAALSTPNGPDAWANFQINPNPALNRRNWARGNHGIRFACRSSNIDPAIVVTRVQLVAQTSPTSWVDGRSRFSAGRDWAQVDLPLSSFVIQDQSSNLTMGQIISQMVGIQFGFNTISNVALNLRGIELQIDDIEIY